MIRSRSNNMRFSVGIIIVSDRASAGEREDKCIPAFRSFLDESKYSIEHTDIVPDDAEKLTAALNKMIASDTCLILTSGGTGCTPRDITPEVTKKIIEKPTPGVDQAIRTFSAQYSSNAIFSRAVSGVAKNSFIINLPGSPKAVSEILEFLLPIIGHPLRLIAGQLKDCQKDSKQND
ncbi:MAG: MogA/MoaB family molybdenum cofactor biosynthesis protein [candidate division Zixibacteria bacterium]